MTMIILFSYLVRQCPSSSHTQKMYLSFTAVRDRLVPPPPPPHHLYAKTNSSSAVYLHWGRPAFSKGQTVNYTVRCNPVGLQNASLVLYLQT